MSIIRPSSACSESRIAPRTEVSASSFWGGSLPAWSGGMEMAMSIGPCFETDDWELRLRLRRGDDRLDLGRDALVHLDGHHVRAGVPDRLLEVHLAAVQL